MIRPERRDPAPGDIDASFARDAAVPPAIAVVIPTFRRPDHLRRTLASVLAQENAPAFAPVVVENDAEGGEGAAAARAMLADHHGPSRVIIARRRGNCAAYNAGFHTALTAWPDLCHIAIIDDDEIAPPYWLATLARVAADHGAHCTGAPQHPVFEGGDERMVRHRVFRAPYATTGAVPILYSSGNVLLSADLLRRHGHPWLDERFNFLGGGDSDFYARVARDGARFAWAAEAGVDETTAARRTELSWLNARSLRNGSISALLQQRAASGSGDHVRRMAKSAALLAASPYRAARIALKERSLTMALDPINVAMGRALMEFGFANEQYRAAEAN